MTTRDAERPAAIFFDVDFTLIHPGPTFGGDGYRRFAARHGLRADPSRFGRAAEMASVELDECRDPVYRPEPFVRFAARILVEMGAHGARIHACAREIYDEWAACRHFALYDDVHAAFAELHGAGYRLGLISNTHRCLTSFQHHFRLERYVSVAVSSADHGYLKPHPSIFRSALDRIGVAAGRGLMVGDSMAHDVAGARGVGMGAVLLTRTGRPAAARPNGVSTIRTLAELPALLDRHRVARRTAVRSGVVPVSPVAR